jgi:hypothetical protein
MIAGDTQAKEVFYVKIDIDLRLHAKLRVQVARKPADRSLDGNRRRMG